MVQQLPLIKQRNLKFTIMKKIDSSLCATCIYKNSCVLTESKRFIWSCSEFDSDKSHLSEEVEILKPELELI